MYELQLLESVSQGYSYNANGSRASLTTPLGTSHYGYDAAGRWTGLADWAGATSTWNYDNGDRLIGSTSPLGVKTNFAYNGLGQLIAQEQVGSAFVGGSGGSAGEVLAKWGDPSSAASRLLYSPGGQLQRQVATTARYALGGTITFGNDFRSQIDKELSTRGLGYQFSVVQTCEQMAARMSVFIDKNGIVRSIDKQMNPLTHGIDVLKNLPHWEAAATISSQK